jgi:hypothetical protein
VQKAESQVIFLVVSTGAAIVLADADALKAKKEWFSRVENANAVRLKKQQCLTLPRDDQEECAPSNTRLVHGDILVARLESPAIVAGSSVLSAVLAYRLPILARNLFRPTGKYKRNQRFLLVGAARQKAAIEPLVLQDAPAIE